MPPVRPILLSQNILDGRAPSINRPIPTSTVAEVDLANSDLLSIFDHPGPLGISPGFSAAGRLIALAITDDKACRIVEFQQPKRGIKKPGPLPQRLIDARKLLQDRILCRPMGDIFAFDMGPLCMSLYCDLNIRITNAVDIQSAFSAVDRKPLSAIKAALGDSVGIKQDNVKTLFLYPVYNEEDKNRAADLAQRAWVSQFLPGYENGAELFEKVPRIDTMKLEPQLLDMIAKIANDSLRLDQKKPLQTTHTFIQSLDSASDQVRLSSNNYNTRLRGDRHITMKVAGQGGQFTTRGVMAGVSGRSGNVNTDRTLTDKVIASVTSIGRDDPTTAEAKRADTILRILQGSEKLLDSSPWIQNIWFPNDDSGLLSWPKEWSPKNIKSPAPVIIQPEKSVNLVRRTLNPSQQDAVNYMLSEHDDHRITVVQGPPGTGKTSVISNYVQYAVELQGKRGIWLVAQSNVAVKNIAEKLIKDGFENWKLLVSKDFHYDWHEHLYGAEIENHLVRSDNFNIASNKANLRGTHVVLCTLSMLSNNSITKFTREIPLKVLVVDEASQIEIGNYITVFSSFKHSLRKACFIGDDKQLPPFGQEDLQDLQSIFEVTHLRKHVVFLDTQYRMPPQIGTIVSEAVYENKLKSNPAHPITDQTIACYFIDVPGKEKPLQGGSFRNELECQAILQLARKLQEQEKNYRIITPYEGQRSYIENMMKEEGLEWGDKCFNVDSFQGNEEDFIIISLVRSRDLGFLNNLRRTNVMLTRCKRGMFIVSSRQFLNGPGAKTLVGTFLKKIGQGAWLTQADIEGGNF